jgi:hypothetical protein
MHEEHTILVSMDNIHIPGSVKQMRTAPGPLGESVVSFELKHNHISEGNGEQRDLRWMPSELTASLSASLTAGTFAVPELASQTNPKATYSVLGEFLYGLENLRKNRSGGEATEELVQDDVPPNKERA